MPKEASLAKRSPGQALMRGRDALRRQAWKEAFEHLSDADRETSLTPEDVEGFAMTAKLIGKEKESLDLLIRAHQSFIDCGEVRRAARCACWLAMSLLNTGEVAQGGGWVARGQRLLEDHKQD